MNRPLVLAVAGLTLATLPLAAQDSFPPRAPSPTRLAPVRFPPFTESTLPNGMTLLVVENHSQPMLSVSLSFRAGSTRDPAGKEGLAELTAQILTKGSTKHTGDQLAALIEGVGAASPRRPERISSPSPPTSSPITRTWPSPSWAR